MSRRGPETYYIGAWVSPTAGVIVDYCWIVPIPGAKGCRFVERSVWLVPGTFSLED